MSREFRDDDLFSLLQSLRSEVAQFRADVRWLKTPPLSETLEAVGTGLLVEESCDAVGWRKSDRI